MTDPSAIASRIRIQKVDITTLEVDAIVNAANERMLGGGGVDGAIHRAAGGGLLEECLSVDEVSPGVRCPTGEARITGGHELPARHVIHTVGPIWNGGDSGEPDLLASCYRSSLELAEDNDIRTIAFPAISCGVYGYPLEKAAAVAMHETASFLSRNDTLTEVVFAALDDKVLAALEDAKRSEPLLRHPSERGKERPVLTDEAKQRLLAFARETLERHLEQRDPPSLDVESDAILEQRAAFVTWRERATGNLRGCIGEVVARRPLVDSIARMAVASGTQDPRFPAISMQELPHLKVEISALTPMTPITPQEVVVGKHGLMISRGHFSGLLLPQVPIEQGWNKDEFLRGLCAKAGLPYDAWQSDDVELRSFEAEVWGEED